MTLNFFPWYVWAGLIGVVLVLLAYFLLQARKLHGNGTTYQLMNALGALGVLLSLTFGKFNLSAFLLELAWLLISIYGIVFGVRSRKASRDSHRDEPW